MWSCRVIVCVLAVVLIGQVEQGQSFRYTLTSAEWTNFKALYGKIYASTTAEIAALYYYNYNRKLIDNHNYYYQNNLRTYGLAPNQFTDLHPLTFNALFPVTTPLTISHAVVAPAVQDAPTSYNPATQGFTFSVQDQGTVCNSGWAYATAKSIEILQAPLNVNAQPVEFSAQNLIDCAGASTGCTRQVPQQAFDYLTFYNRPLYYESSYPNVNTQANQGMCIPTGTETTTLTSYSTLNNGAEDALKKYVGAGYPVVIEYNPTSFEFMHYSEGVFQEPITKKGSHFMTVIGYGTDTTRNLDYWLVQNSFGTTWGESGLIRILRSTAKPITKSAIFPVE